MMKKIKEEDIKRKIDHLNVGDQISFISPPSDYNGLEAVLYGMIPPDFEQEYPQHASYVSEIRKELRKDLEESLDPECRDDKNMKRLNIIVDPYLKNLQDNIPDFTELCAKTKFSKETQEVIAYNTAVNKKYKGRTIRLCAACASKGLWERCSGCKIIHYCGKECQRSHWDIHKNECLKYWNV